MSDNLFNVGKIVNTHGIKGEVKVVRITDFEERFKNGEKLYFVGKDESHVVPLVIDGHRQHKNFDLLHFESYDSINQVEHFKDGFLKISQDQLTPLEEGDFYYHEIIGCRVLTVSGEELGEIKEILSPGANDVWVVKRDKQKDILIPYIEDIVKQVNIAEQTIVIEPMEGLLD
ncbi:ribosome maturation factor RimM [Aquibacillus rhizosphaerae]|uniref:Ribosome maturation factor RimM n=1 Tax=Aquibacillus rhizosphaerae TaxID=3051431 RepID=A0ABT7L632_9BACI|nr:ribosome maturation factor RimM [Aquibacillus sp. LR5S19]MDL4840040.1 ribosome maturation factor RimM [Aquibacillus sp. LR5S19]